MTAANLGSDRAFVLGLDGVPWGLVEQWSDDGTLPNFGRLVDEGASGPLESTTPATTAPSWPSIATGVYPDRHGIYDFQRLDSSYSHRMNTSRDWTARPMWDRLAPAVVGNVPMTYPAQPLDGQFVAGMMSPEPGDGFTYPDTLRDEIARHIPEYTIGLDWATYAERPDEFLDELDALLDRRIELLRLLMERRDWRLFFFVFTAPDRLQHLIWDEDVLRDHYRELDDVLGDVMDYAASRDATLYVVSDHGFGPVSTVVNINRLLEKHGYLARQQNSGTRGVLTSLGVTKANVRNWLERTGVSEDSITSYLPQAFVDMVALQVPGNHSLYDIEFAETQAFFHGKGELYVNDTERFDDGTVPPESVPELKRSIASLLADYEDPEAGTRPFTVHDGDDVYPADEYSPDLVVTVEPGYDTLTMLTDDVFNEPDAKAGGHHPEGIFLAWGPDVDAGATVQDAAVVNVAPTVLHGAGEPIPDPTDGRVLESVFASGTWPDANEPTSEPLTATERTASDDSGGLDQAGEEQVEERLRGLGYMD